MGVSLDDILPREHRARAERLEQLRQLYAGEHRAYFVEAGRSQFEFSAIREHGRPFFTPADLLGLIARKTADLLFGEAPRAGHANSAIGDAIGEIVDRSSLHGELIDCATELAWAGESYLEIVAHKGNAYLRHAEVASVFPVGSPAPDGQYGRYVRYMVETIEQAEGAAAREVTLLLETTYTTGRIDRACFEVRGRERVATELDRWPARTFDGTPLAKTETTDLDRPSLVRFRNGAKGDSDFTRQLIDAQDLLNAKQTQLSRVILRHAEPRLFMVESQAAASGNLRATDDVLYGDSPDAIPRYLTWEAQLDAAMKDRDFARQSMLTIAEMPASFLGIKDDATAESASKMRLNAIQAIAKAQRKAAYVIGSIRLALRLALRTELIHIEAGDLIIQIRDGIPDDERERAEVIAMLRGAGVISLRRALAMQQLEEAEIESELEALAEEARQQMPGMLLGEPNGGSNVAGSATDTEEAA